MKIKIKYVIFFMMLLGVSNVNFAAGIRLSSENLVKYVIFFKTQQERNNNERSGLPYYPYLNPGQQYQIDAGLNGFYSICWTNENGITKEATLDILGITGWRDVKILSDDRVYIGQWGLDLAHTINSFNR